MSVKQCISGPYRATKLWNDAVRSFYNGMPVSRHWRGLRQYERCFTATEAIDWLLNHLQSDPNFANSVSREQTTKLLRKFLKAGLIEDVRGNTTKPEDFKDNRELYKFSNRSPLKALRTPRTPGRPVLGPLHSNTSNPRQDKDEGASPILRRIHGSVRESTKATENLNNERQRDGSIRVKNWPKRLGSIHLGENAANEVKDRGGMQECHLVAKQLSKAEINDVWKHVLLGKLDSVCERLLFGDTSSILDTRLVEGEWIHHNMTKVTSRGVVQVPEGHPDDLPNWILTAMKCMAHWPSIGDTSCNIPNYPGVEKDVFKIVRDFFTNLVVPLIPYGLYEPFIRIYIGVEFLDITCRSPNSVGTLSSSGRSYDGSYVPEGFNEGDSVEDLMLNMSISGQQKTSTPNTENENNTNGEKWEDGYKGFRRQGSSRSLGGGFQTPLVSPTATLNASNLQSLKLRRLKNYTDFKEDNLYPTLLEGSHEGSALGILLDNQENGRSLSRQSKISSEPSMQRQPETVRSVKTNDYARRVRKENDFKEANCESAGAIKSNELNSFELPQNCCFETAFTSDSPKTRIIPQKSVDSLHFKNGGRANGIPKQRPKSIAVPSCSSCERPGSATSFNNTKDLKNVSSFSDLFKSSIMSTNTSDEYVTALVHSPLNRSRSAGNLEILNEDKVIRKSSESVSVHNLNDIIPPRSLASRIRDSIKRKHIRDDLCSRKRINRSRDNKDRCEENDEIQAMVPLRTKSGGHSNPGFASMNISQEDNKSNKSFASDYQEHGPGLSHLRTKSGGFLNLALMPSSDSIDTVDSGNTFSGPPTTCSHTAVMHQCSVSPVYGYSKRQEHSSIPRTEVLRRRHSTADGCLSHSLSSSGFSVYHSVLSQPSRNSPSNPPGPPVPPRSVRPVSGMGGIYSASQLQESRRIHDYENVSDFSKQLSSSANELSDKWADRTPYGQVPPFAKGGVWRHYHSSPSKRLIGRRKGIEFYYGSKACLPGLLTREGKDAAISSVQLLLLLLAPVRRRKLHLLLRMMSKMSSNDRLTLDQEQSTRALVLNTFTRCILLCDQEVDYDEVLSLRIVSFLMDNHEEVLRPPQDLAVLVHRRLSQIQRCQVSNAEYERQRMTGSQQYLGQLLDQIVDNEKISAKSRKKKLKEFKSLYPEVYKARFPEEQKPENRSKMRSLIKLASFSSLNKGRTLRI
ncbi:DEP domain-containing protein 1A isoform X2 [Cherax quadricarinatus]|uniref:DEP domain-containing protein 1A isoform X2 n=1 Tax=Cherax quadricarinatus TaxID=27406 RepID=UPI00387EDFD1